MTGSTLSVIRMLTSMPPEKIWDVKEHKERRSKDANALLWWCIGRISEALTRDKWDIYLEELRRYGKYTYVLCHPQAVEALKKQWRETEEIGRVNVNGKEAVQLLCYYGSSTLTTSEFSALLNGVIDDMIQMELDPPTPKEMKIALEKWEKMYAKHYAD